MFISKIRLNNFKSFAGEHEINFEETQGVWWVSGRIGSGKTSIGEAIIFGLFGSISGKNNKDLITWDEKHSVVEVWCRSKNNDIYIKRENNSYGQNPLYVEVNGEPVEFTSKKDAQSQLEQEYLDATRTTMELLCIISFNNFKSLSTLNAKDTKQFLDYVLGLDILTSYINLCKEEQSILSNDIRQSQANKNSIEAQVSRMENQTFIEGDIEHERKEIKKAENKIQEIRDQFVPFIEDQKKLLKEKQTRLTEVKTLGVSKKKEIDFIKKGICPTCGAPIDQSHLEIKEKERENLLKQYTEINSEISLINERISQEQSKLCNCIGEQDKLITSHKNMIIRLQEQSKQHRANEEEILKLKNEILSQEKIIESANIDSIEYDELINCFQTTIRSKMMESFVPHINNKIKEIAAQIRMPYIPEYDLSFKCSIKSGSMQQIPTSSLSTGQLKLVDTIIILAIISSVVSKVKSNVIFLDELFSNIDGQTRTDLLITLKTILPSNTSILISSHQDMDEELIDGYIKMRLEKEGDKFFTKFSLDKQK